MNDNSYLLKYSVVENVNKIDQVLQNSLTRLESLISDCSDEELNNNLCIIASKSKENHDSIQLGLLHKILISPVMATTHFRDIITTSRDNFTFLFKILNILVAENLYRFKPLVLAQLIWFTNECLKHSINNADGLVYNILRSLIIPESRRNAPNFHLVATQAVIDLINNNKRYFLNHPHLIRDTLTIMLNLIPMHCNLHQVAYQEIELSYLLLTEKFDECIIIGRDLVRFLISVANINGLNVFWNNFVSSPYKLSQNFSGIMSVLDIATSRHLSVTCITQNVEQFITFILHQIAKFLVSDKKEKDYNFYMNWLDKRFIMNQSNGSTSNFQHPHTSHMNQNSRSSVIRANIVRFVILYNLKSALEIQNQQHSNLYDTSMSDISLMNNEKSISDIAIESKSIFIECLLSQHGAIGDAHLILAIIFELLVFNYKTPINHSISTELFETWKILQYFEKNNPAYLCAICDFIPTIASNFIAELENEVLLNITAAIQFCLNKIEIKVFSEFLKNISKKVPTISSSEIQNIKDPKIKIESQKDLDDTKQSKSSTTTIINQDNVDFNKISDKDQKMNLDITQNSHPLPIISQIQDFGEIINNLKGKNKQDLAQSLKSLGKKIVKINDEAQIQNFIDEYIIKLCSIIRLHSESIFNLDQNHFKISIDIIFDSLIVNPIFSFLASLFKTKSSSDTTNKIFNVIDKMSHHLQDMTLLLLIYDVFFKEINSSVISCSTRNIKSKYEECSSKFSIDTSIYVKYWTHFKSQSLVDFLYNDLDKCSLKCHQIFFHFLIKIYDVFGSKMVDDSRFMHLICGTLDSDQVKSLRQQIALNNIYILPKDDIVDLIDDSLNWESIEQIYFWQILLAHNLSLNQIWQIIPDLEWNLHSEAINIISILLKNTEPQLDLMKCLFSRHIHTNADNFVILILEQWMPNFKTKLIASLIDYLKYLVTNSRLEVRNISLTLNQLNLLFNSPHCQYIFQSLNIMEALLKLMNHCRHSNEIDEKFLEKIEGKVKSMKS